MTVLIQPAFLGLFKHDQYKIENKNKYDYDKAFELLKLMIEKGADVNAVDSYGRDCFQIFCGWVNDRRFDKTQPFLKETIEELSRILQLLIDAGMETQRKPNRGWTIFGEEYQNILDQLTVNYNT